MYIFIYLFIAVIYRTNRIRRGSLKLSDWLILAYKANKLRFYLLFYLIAHSSTREFFIIHIQGTKIILSESDLSAAEY